ncbi:uncharacterized protein LOC133714071 [Rosa rugosa]|uniref:uncharacterized protein LOC133714071 n=1 Tax=Rosa rugosa TaxID=74645 RepID=UPI002B41795E|nr:uncharacterized protein LOC133714071 [Rosa rugosa]
MQLSKPECEGMEVLERIALFWPLTSKTGRSLIAQRAIELAAQATGGTLPAASTPAPQEGGANGPSAAKRKREASDEASRINRRRIEEEDLKLVWEAILGNLHGDIGMEVIYWVDIFDVAELLGRVEGVEVMENFLQLETSVAAVLVQNQRSITTPKVYFSLWTSQRLVELSIATTPWPRFRVEVRGVHVYEQPGDEIEVAENEVEEGEEEEEAAEGVHGHEQAGEEAEAAEGVHGHEQAGEEAEAAEGVHGHEQAGNEVKEEAGENVEEEVEAAEGVHGHKQAGNEVKEEAAEKVEEEAE